MKLRLLVYGGPSADHNQSHGVTVQIEVLDRTPAFDIAFSVSSRAAAGPFDFAASSGLKQRLCVADCPDAAVTVFSHMLSASSPAHAGQLLHLARDTSPPE
jgi:hypothetical protein